MATEVIRTVKSAGGDYTTLTAWEAGEQRDLVAVDQIATAECYDFALTDDVAINGWTTDATRYIKIYAPTAERHNGTARAVSGSGFSITPSGTTATPIRIAVPHVYLEGLEIVGNATSVPTILASIGAGELYIDQCVIHDTQTGTGYTVSLSTSGVALRMRNTVVYGSCRSADLRNVTSALLENCTFWRHAAQLGVLGNSTLTTRNCYSGHAGAASEDWWTGGTAPSGNNNASSDSSAATDYTSTVTSVASSVFVSVTAGSEDFHLQTGTNALVGAGADLSASFTVDIDGDTQPSGSAWDIGADYRAAAGGSFSTSGALSAGSATVAGTATHLTLHATSGALAAQEATVSGTAAHGAGFTSSGALTAQAATVAGSATRLALHTTSGALAAQAATVSGAAVHPHLSSGALAAQAATVAGTAVHGAGFTSSGALTAQAATVAGTAAHLTLHTSTGALAAQSAAVAGAAAHFILHATSGALAAGSATVAGASELSSATHDTTGALAAQAATVSGVAERIAAGLNLSTGAVVYLSLRAASGLWTSPNITPSANLSGLKTWLPPSRVPIGYVNGDRSKPVVVDESAWYSFLNYLVNTVLGGPTQPTLPDVTSSVTEAVSQAASSSATVNAVAQQTQANAEALAATVQVTQAASLPGSGLIPPVQQGYLTK